MWERKPSHREAGLGLPGSRGQQSRAGTASLPGLRSSHPPLQKAPLSPAAVLRGQTCWLEAVLGEL